MEKLSELLQSMKLNEAKNAELYYNISRLFARYCGREQTILKRTLQILETSIMLQPENAAYHAEIGHQQFLTGDFTTAFLTFQKAATFDDNYLMPLYGMIHCRIRQDMVDDAQHQLEFLAEISESQGKTAEHCFLEALVEWRKKGNKTEAIKQLDNCLNLHIAQTK